MNNPLSKAAEVEALTFVYGTTGPSTRAERNRWSSYLTATWASLRKRSKDSVDSSSAVDFSSWGL